MSKDLGVIICAAGRSERMGGENKILMEILGIPVILRAVSAFDGYFRTREIVVATSRESRSEVERLLSTENWSCKVITCLGGESRAESVSNALDFISADAEMVAVHDGARAFVTRELIDRTYTAAKSHGAAVPCLSVSEATHIEDNGFLVKSIPRNQVKLAQTPQIFARDIILSAYRWANRESYLVFDDCSLVIKDGGKCAIVEGEAENIKLTTPQDLAGIESASKTLRAKVGDGMRIGHGYDVHRLAKSRKLVLGGVLVENKLGLLGHSDADVLTHAIIDALLGAAGQRDIGHLFPDNDISYAGISSIELLKTVMEKLKGMDFKVKNIDSTIICQSPKLGSYIPLMQAQIAAAVEVNATQVNIKATTEEGLGFTGKGKGIAVHAVCLLIQGEEK